MNDVLKPRDWKNLNQVLDYVFGITDGVPTWVYSFEMSRLTDPHTQPSSYRRIAADIRNVVGRYGKASSNSPFGSYFFNLPHDPVSPAVRLAA